MVLGQHEGEEGAERRPRRRSHIRFAVVTGWLATGGREGGGSGREV
jgi:hypothetical protein